MKLWKYLYEHFAALAEMRNPKKPKGTIQADGSVARPFVSTLEVNLKEVE